MEEAGREAVPGRRTPLRLLAFHPNTGGLSGEIVDLAEDVFDFALNAVFFFRHGSNPGNSTDAR